MAVARLGISSESFYKMDAAELYWAYKTWREGLDLKYQERYEVARFLGILIKNAKLLPRLREVLPFFWEKGVKAVKPVKQSVADMKNVVMALARKQGISKKPLKRKTPEQMKSKKP